MYCINCGKEIVNNYKFCINCGKEIKNSNVEDTKIEKKEQNEQIEYIKDNEIVPIMGNNIVIPLIFGILLATILSIVCISSFNKEQENVLRNIICKQEII